MIVEIIKALFVLYAIGVIVLCVIKNTKIKEHKKQYGLICITWLLVLIAFIYYHYFA